MRTEPPTEEQIPAGAGRLAAVILAAGMGKRMRSRLPKVLHRIAGAPLVAHVLGAVAPLRPSQTALVVGHGGDQVRAAVGDRVGYVTQAEQLGTGHAVLQARAALEGRTRSVLVLYGDSPLLQSDTLATLVALHEAQPGARVTMLTCVATDPTGYGRIIRDADGAILDIVEERVATPEQRAITEINSGIYCFDSAWLWPRLAALPVHAGAGEYYLTDMIGVAIAEAPNSVQALCLAGEEETAGINDRVQLAEAEAIIRDRIRTRWLREGVTMIDPGATYIDVDVTLGQDTILYPGCYLEGQTRVGADCRIGPNAHLVDAVVGDRCVVGASLLEGCELEADVDVGSFNHLRRAAYLSSGVHLGNFAEVKNARLGPHVAMGHFSYVGDATIGARTNVGAGVITANFDGARKHHSDVGADVFLGSDTVLRAPVAIGDGAATGAGSVVTHDVEPGALVVGAPARPAPRRAPAAADDGAHPGGAQGGEPPA
jgi:bifunctional UDP-N-acetylglucosamine pyrophosphorylase / glucosamine-1-phosphate N-acetyltransferase